MSYSLLHALPAQHDMRLTKNLWIAVVSLLFMFGMTRATGNMTGVVSERDYICKIALLGRTSKETPVKEIATVGANIITATADESVQVCMEKMMNHGVRHLPIVDASKKVIGMVSIKDLVKTVVKEKEEAIKVLSDFALGKGGHFGSD